MAKDYTVGKGTIARVNKFLESIMEIDGVDADTAWPKALRLARRKDWALDAVLRHAITGRCGGNADAALDALWGNLGRDAHDAFMAGDYDRHGYERAPVATVASDMPMLLHLGRIGL